MLAIFPSEKASHDSLLSVLEIETRKSILGAGRRCIVSASDQVTRKSNAEKVAGELAFRLRFASSCCETETLGTKRKERGRELRPPCRRGEEGTIARTGWIDVGNVSDVGIGNEEEKARKML